MRITVFGAGSWGCALAHQMARRGHDVVLWALEPEVAAGINADHRNPIFLTDAELHPAIRSTSDLESAASHSDVWIWVVPVQFSRAVMNQLAPLLRDEVVLVSASKGIETESLRRMDELAEEALGISHHRFCCLSGPTFAIEVVRGDPSAAVLACSDMELATRLQEEFSDFHLRCYAGSDLIGVELAGALKNTVAIAAGIIDGLGLGGNTQAALMTRGLHENTRTLDQILGSMREVAEGVRTTPAAAKLATQLGVEMPITQSMAMILGGEIDPKDALKELMTRQLKVETQL